MKVWFQNRRTKHKRQKTEGEEDDGKAGGGSREGHKSGQDSDEEMTMMEEDSDIDPDGDSDESQAFYAGKWTGNPINRIIALLDKQCPFKMGDWTITITIIIQHLHLFFSPLFCCFFSAF